MSIKVLIADDDLDIHQLVADILEINFTDVHIERALEYKGFIQKLTEADGHYDLIIVNTNIGGDIDAAALIEMLRNDYPATVHRIVMLSSTTAMKPDDELLKDIPFVIKPFSLDSFGEIVKNVCGR